MNPAGFPETRIRVHSLNPSGCPETRIRDSFIESSLFSCKQGLNIYSVNPSSFSETRFRVHSLNPAGFPQTKILNDINGGALDGPIFLG